MRLVIVSEEVPPVGGVCVKALPLDVRGITKPWHEAVLRSPLLMAWSEQLRPSSKGAASQPSVLQKGATLLTGFARTLETMVGRPDEAAPAPSSDEPAGADGGLHVNIPRVEAAFQELRADLADALVSAYERGAKDGRAGSFTGSDETPQVAGVWVSRDPSLMPTLRQPFEDRCITVLPSQSGAAFFVPSSNARLFQGAFSQQQQLQGILGADGGNSRVHVFARSVARELFQRHGGGILESGRYVLHPKRENTLVPLDTFHTDMLQEMTREVRVVMGRIGARKLVVETIEGVTFSGRVVSRVPMKSGAAELSGSERDERRLTFEWGKPTFEPAQALADCVWIRDNAGAMTIVDQRRTSDLVRYEEFSRVDTSFRLGLDVMGLFKAGFSWASESTYRYSVEFFSRA